MQTDDEVGTYNARSDAAIQHKLAAMFSANKDEVAVPKIYIDMTDDWVAAAILDELLFWTLPKKHTGKTSLRVRKEGKLWLAVRRQDWWDRKRIKERQADRGIEKLEELGLIEKEVFNFNGKPTMHLRMVMPAFVRLYSQKIAEQVDEDEPDESLKRDISDLYEMMSISPNGEGVLPNGDIIKSPNGDIINSPVNSPNTPSADAEKISKEKVLDPANRTVDYILQTALGPKAIQDAMAKHFMLTPNWDGNKTNRQWMQWAMGENVTAAQIEHAANLWKSDKRFNWQQYSLKSIQEHWLTLRGSNEQRTEAEIDANGAVVSW